MSHWIDCRAPVFFDTDCFACFLWTSSLLTLHRLIPGRLFLPEEVISELEQRKRTFRKVQFALSDLKKFIETGRAKVIEIPVTSPKREEYLRLVRGTFNGVCLGSGESAAMVHARFDHGIVASNNHRDVSAYCDRYEIPIIDTSAIMIAAVDRRVLSLDEACSLWSRMLREGRWLPTDNFMEVWRGFAPSDIEVAASDECPLGRDENDRRQ